MHGVEIGSGEALAHWSPNPRGHKLAAADDWEAAAVLALVARHQRIPIRLLLHNGRCAARVAAARHLTMYLMHVMLGRSLAEVGRFFGRDRTTVGYACARIEDRRDLRRFDTDVLRLEQRIANQMTGEEDDHGA